MIGEPLSLSHLPATMPKPVRLLALRPGRQPTTEHIPAGRLWARAGPVGHAEIAAAVAAGGWPQPAGKTANSTGTGSNAQAENALGLCIGSLYAGVGEALRASITLSAISTAFIFLSLASETIAA